MILGFPKNAKFDFKFDLKFTAIKTNSNLAPKEQNLFLLIIV